MNQELFDKAIAAADKAMLSQDAGSFIVAVRIAQSATLGNLRVCQLLETALQEFPSSKARQTISSLIECSLKTGKVP